MTETAYILQHFDEAFSRYRSLRIVLHGTRNYAREIAARYGGTYSFVGCMTFDETEASSFCGLPLLAPEDLRAYGTDMIILTERVRHAERAFQSLRDLCEREHILLFNMYGLDETAVHREYDPFPPKRLAELRLSIDSADVVFFELMGGFFTEPDALEVYPLSRALFSYARSRDKTILFSLRRTFPEERQLQALAAQQLFPAEELERHVIRRHGEDLSFRAVAETYAGKCILYFCSGLVNEFILPRCYGIHTIHINTTGGFNWELSLREMAAAPGMFSAPSGADPYTSLLEEASACDIVSFDIFDTLLVRKTLSPEDVFALTGRKAVQRGLLRDADAFAEARRAVQRSLPYGDIHALYDALRQLLSLTEEQAGQLLQLETETELGILTPRRSVCRLLRALRERGKHIVLISDMYYPEQDLRKILEHFGITQFEKLLVSCDHGCFKQNGLFSRIWSAFGHGRSIFHIGDDPQSDGAAAAAYGIDARLLPSARKMAESAGWKLALSCAQRLEERCLAGLLTAAVFNDPFENCLYRELSPEKKQIRYAQSACTAVLTGYLVWLAGRLRTAGVRNVLFAARDGLLLADIYEELRSRSGTALPEGKYLHTSRHASFLLCADRVDMTPALETIFHRQTPGDIFRHVYGIPLTDRDGTELSLSALVRLHEADIRTAAAEQRAAFRRYLAEQQIDPDARHAFVDLVSSGKTQYFLTAGAGLQLEGLYVAIPLNRDETRENITAFMKDDPLGCFQHCYMEMEQVMSSSDPSVDSYAPDGTPVFSRETRSEKEIRDILRMQEEIRILVKDFLSLFYFDDCRISPQFADELYAADGVHGIFRDAFDDWGKAPVT